MRSSKFAFNIALREEIVREPNARPLTTVSFVGEPALWCE
jgi:hypothetical protein